jgi:hypothetical protein
MQDTLIVIWLTLVIAFCLVGIWGTIRSISKAVDADEDIKRAIAEGEIDNFGSGNS